MLNGGELQAFPLKSGRRSGFLWFPCMFNIALEFLARTKRQVKEIRELQRGKEEVSLFTGDMIPIHKRL